MSSPAQKLAVIKRSENSKLQVYDVGRRNLQELKKVEKVLEHPVVHQNENQTRLQLLFLSRMNRFFK
jgi:hypothetical protein